MNNPHPEPVQPGTTRVEPERLTTAVNGATEPYPGKEWLTIAEAQILFRHLGLPRSPEAIRKYCRQEKLASQTTAGPTGDQHMVERKSIVPFVEEQLRIQGAQNPTVPERPGTTRHVPVQTVMTRVEPDQTGTNRNDPVSINKIEELEKKLTQAEAEKKELVEKNHSLEIDKAVRDQMVKQLQEERGTFLEQMQADRQNFLEQIKIFSSEAGALSRELGQMETKLELTAPQAPVTEQPLATKPTQPLSSPVEAERSTLPPMTHEQPIARRENTTWGS